PASGEVHLPTGSTESSLAEADSEASLGDGELGSLGSTPVSQAASGSVSAAAAIPSATLDAAREATRVRSEVWFGMPPIITASVRHALKEHRSRVEEPTSVRCVRSQLSLILPCVVTKP